MITLLKAKQRQQSLQNAASHLLSHYDLERLISPLGVVHRTGSYKYGLMVKPDIDYLIFNPKPIDTLEPVANFARELTLMPGIAKVRVANHLIWPETPGVPKSIYLGINLIWQKVMWQVDIHIHKKADMPDPINFPVGWDEKLTPQQKDAALLLKAQLYEQKRYPGEFRSADIYRAVLNNKVESITELENWRKTNPYF